MRHGRFNHGYEVDDVVGMVKLVFKDRVRFHSGSADLRRASACITSAGHTGRAAVRARSRPTAAGSCWPRTPATTTSTWRPAGFFPTAFHVGEMVEGYDKLRALAESPQHIIPGHDPLVMDRYPAPSKDLGRASSSGSMCRRCHDTGRR
jgi:hypothetical protein